jgi:hypothetical protein
VLVIVGPAPGGLTRTITCDRAVSIGEGELNYSREEEGALEVEFECMKNADNALSPVGALGAFGTIVDA